MTHSPNGLLRVDILIWDTDDTRHAVKGRDDNANLERMYFHLAANVFGERLPDDDIQCTLYPDRQDCVDWEEMRGYLERRSFNQMVLSENQKIMLPYWIKSIEEKESASTPFIQVADFFCGLAAFSYNSFEKWKAYKSGDTAGFSKSERERCLVLDRLNNECKKQKLKISLNGYGGLYSYQPRNSPNFWLYQPQTPQDKAPVKLKAVR